MGNFYFKWMMRKVKFGEMCVVFVDEFICIGCK